MGTQVNAGSHYLENRQPLPPLEDEQRVISSSPVWIRKDFTPGCSFLLHEPVLDSTGSCLRLKSDLGDEDSGSTDLGLSADGSGLDLHRLHHGHGRLEDHLNRGNGGLLHHQGGLVLVQPVEILFHRLHCCQQLLWLPCALVCGGSVTNCSSWKIPQWSRSSVIFLHNFIVFHHQATSR